MLTWPLPRVRALPLQLPEGVGGLQIPGQPVAMPLSERWQDRRGKAQLPEGGGRGTGVGPAWAPLLCVYTCYPA